MIRKRSPFLLLLLTLDAAASAFVAPRTRSRGGVIPTTAPRRHVIELNAAPSTAGVVSGRNLAVAGRIPWGKLLITRKQAVKIASIMRAETHVMDIVLVLILSAFPQRIGKILYKGFLHRLRDDKVAYEDSITFQVADTVGEASQIALVCYFIDTVEVALEVTGIKGKKMDVSTLIAKLIYATWACFRARMYKRSFFETVAEHTPRKMRGKKGMVEILDKISDFFLFGILGLTWTDILRVKRGSGLSSIFALGGAVSFALTLASQDLAKRALNGLALAAVDAFHVGDQILLGDGTEGHVVSVGWLDTEIRGSNELITRIPNTQLSDIRISNRSRMKFSQVKQKLRFKYRDLDKIPDLVTDIREEIAASCPKVITDGSKVFRVRWTDYKEDHVEVLVDCRLRNPPTGEKYYEARQGVLEAIARAAKRKNVEFAVPVFEEIPVRGKSGKI